MPYDGSGPTISPDARPGDDYQRLDVRPDQFGAAIGQGLQQLGAGVEKMEQFHDQVSVDDQVNKVMSAADVIRRGDPNGVQRDANGQPVLGPDGKPQQNLGYLGMKGEDALHARGGVEAQIDQQIAAARSNLSSPEARLQFDQQTRRMRSAWANEIGDHAERQAQVWGVGVQNSAADLARQQIAANPGDSEEVLHRTADLVQARVRQAQLTYGNDPTAAADAGRKARAESATTQVEALLNKNPTMAKSVLEANRAGLDPQVYDQLVNRLRPMLAGDQADQAIQRAASGQPVAGGAVQHTPPAGGSPTISDVDALAAEKRLSAGTGTDADRALRATYLKQQNTPPGQQPAAVPAAPSGAAAPATAANGLPLEGPIPPTRPTAAPSAAAPQIGAQEPQDGGNPLLALRNAPAPSYQGWHATLPSAQKANFDTIAQHEADKNGTSLAAGRAAVFKNLSDAAAARGVVLSGGRAQYDAGSQAGPQAGPANIDWDKGGANNAQKFKTLMSYGTSTLGATPNGAAGMLGNAYTESNFRVAAFNPTGEKSHGLFQWNEDAGRWQPYVKWAQSNSLPVYDPYTQFQYAKVESQRMPMHDGSGRSVWQAVNQASSPAEASNIWLVHFENPKVKDFANRANFANEAMTHFDPNFRAPTQSGAQWQGGSAVAPMPGPLMASTLDNGQGGLPPMLPDPSVPSLLQQAQATPSVAPPPAAPTMRQQVPPASAADSAPQALPPPVAYNQDDPSSPLPDRGLALAHARAMAGGDPIQARMNVAEVNRRYEEQNRETYTERMELQQQLPDLNAAASAGVNGVTLPERDIMRLFPTAKALQIIGEFRANQAVGGLMRGVQWASPDQLQEMQRDISSGQGVYSDALRSHRGRATTGAGTTGAEEDSTDIGYFRRRETAARQISSEIQRRTNLLVGPEADPAAYTANNPAVRQAWAQLQANPRDPASYERYAASMLSTQAFLGVPEAQQHLMTRGGATTIANQIASSPDPKATLQQLSAGFGSAWPKVFGDAISLGRLPAGYQAVQVLDDPHDAALLSRTLASEKPGPDGKPAKSIDDTVDLMGGAKGEAAKIRDAVRFDPEVKNYVQSIQKSGSSADQVQGIVSAVETLALAKRGSGEAGDSASAASAAVKSFFGKFDYMPNGGARVPSKSFDAVSANARATIDGLALDRIAVPARFGQPGQPEPREYVDTIKAAPTWITSPKSDALWLMDYAGRVVRGRDGQPVAVPFNAPPPAPTASALPDVVPGL